MLVGDDNGNLSKIPFSKQKEKFKNNRPKVSSNTDPLKDYENVKEKQIELKGLEKFKELSFEELVNIY
jgi:hypothetical protein